jgi:hypothetical protein
MNLGWDWTTRDQYPSAKQQIADWEKENVSLQEQSVPDIFALIKEKRPLPERAVNVLNTMLESDTYIMHVLNPDEIRGSDMGIVTRDIRLCVRVRNFLARKNKHVVVYAIDPLVYCAARVLEIPTLSGLEKPELNNIIEDPGSLLFVEFTELGDDADIDLLLSAPVRVRRHRTGIPVAYLDI